MTGQARPFRFSVGMVTAPTDGHEWRRRCRRAEELGYDVIQLPDHLGMAAPFPALVAAASVTERARLGTYVLNAGFWNPALLAREVATVDALTDGRLELGLGAGYARAEHERAGLAFLGPGGRVDRLRRTVEEVLRLLADEGHAPAVTGRPCPPLLVAGSGDRVLTLAAECAQSVGFVAGRDTPDGPQLLDAAELEERVEFFRGAAGDRADGVELNLVFEVVRITDDALGCAQELRHHTPVLAGRSAEEVLALPTVAIGTAREVAEKLRGHRARYGFTYFSVLDPATEPFAGVIAELRGA
ncbi:TIGR03621 family F420-dependent LLM class oxidoreductase [Streptomyces sp. NPDC047315]|uniref:TIGR03621 family F420-dependent LLM class oxidoreductase n=1 Tax=Streptomyces sp. NPDC047315 TaxID=3155142 RepID=UPI0033ED7286